MGYKTLLLISNYGAEHFQWKPQKCPHVNFENSNLSGITKHVSDYWLKQTDETSSSHIVSWVSSLVLYIWRCLSVYQTSRHKFQTQAVSLKKCFYIKAQQQTTTFELTHICQHSLNCTSCASIRCSSSLVRVSRSRSVLSTTRMTIWKCHINT